jgi:hypothetical protein
MAIDYGKFYRLLIVATFVLALSGCKPISQPWAGTPYQSPQVRDTRHSPSTFSPTPAILPSRVAQTVDTASQDAAIERFLNQNNSIDVD